MDEGKILNRDRWWLLGFFIAALIIYGFNLGEVPLRDWDEAIVASVARNIWRSPENSHSWLYPTIGHQRPYWNKPPLVHWLIACAYSWFGVSEWSTRLFPALLSAISVPLLYLLGREIFITSTGANLATLVYLTLLPMVRHGRLAMLDGAIACWFIFALWCLLRSRLHSRWLLGFSLAIGLACLTKGIMIGVLLGIIAIIFLAWDSPKLLKSGYFWGALVLGVMPSVAWYGMQYLHYGEQFLGINLGEQTFSRIWQPVTNNVHPPWYYLLEIAKYTLPWLLFLPGGIKLALSNYHLAWAKLSLTWGGVYLLAVSLMATKLPWYIIPFYPAFALLVGANLARIWQSRRQSYPLVWKTNLGFLAAVAWGASLYYGIIPSTADRDLQLTLAVIGLSLTLATVLLWYNRYFIVAIAIGWYVALLLLFNSSHWVWELNEAYPVKPIAALVQQHTPARQVVYTSHAYFRPSLDFYSDRQIIPLKDAELKRRWQREQKIYLLVETDTIFRLNLKSVTSLGRAITWQLITKSN